MIYVSRIVGESFDLVNKTELPKMLVITNGSKEVYVHVDEDTVRSVIQLFAGQEPDVTPPDDEVFAAVKELQVAVREGRRLVQSEPPPDQAGPGVDYDDETTGVASL